MRGEVICLPTPPRKRRQRANKTPNKYNMNTTVKFNLPAWTFAAEIGYTPKTTFWADFSIADVFGADAVVDTFKRAFPEWRDNVMYLAELVLVLNHKAIIHSETQGREILAQTYKELWITAHNWALDNLQGSELEKYLEITE